ncbi:MAG: acyl-ACP--UDP-N-acetylglucosamine O-acyltransferase [Ginsengibacter sp.]
MISNLAYINPAACIGSNVKIDPFAVIEAEVTIGDNTHIMSHSIVLEGSVIGKNCKIFPGAVIGAIPQDLKFVGEKTIVQIGDHTTIRECVTVNRGTKEKWKTVIGDHCLLMAYTHVAHDCLIGNYVILANSVQLAGHVEIGDHAILGGLAAAIQFARIGSHTYIAGHTEIRKDVPPFIKAGRNPLSYVGVNSVGLQRRGFTLQKVNEILDIYRHLYKKGMNTTQAVDFIEAELPSSSERNDIISFIRSSEKGIIKHYTKDVLNDVNED